MQATERWLPVPGYEGFYEVSDLGRVRSTPRPRTRGGILSARSRPKYYPHVSLWANGVRRSRNVHLLVLEAFVGPCPPGLECRHLDGDKGNPALSNLVWGTRGDNNRDRTRHSGRVTHCKHGHEYTPENTWIGRTGESICRTCSRARYRARRPLVSASQ